MSGLEGRYELYRRLKLARVEAQQADRLAKQRANDAGALVEALVMDGASLREIGRQLGISHTAVDKILGRYRARRDRA